MTTKKIATPEEIRAAFHRVRLCRMCELPREHQDHIRYGGGLLTDTRNEARKASAFLRKHGLGDDGKPLADFSDETIAERLFDEHAVPAGMPARSYQEGLDAYVKRHEGQEQWIVRAQRCVAACREIARSGGCAKGIRDIASFTWLGWPADVARIWIGLGCRHPGDAKAWQDEGMTAEVLQTIADRIRESKTPDALAMSLRIFANQQAEAVLRARKEWP
jgi:hypothetical protein